jgi:hypothetical protein
MTAGHFALLANLCELSLNVKFYAIRQAKQQLPTLGTFPPEADQPLAEAHFKL